jgi:XTP/dITP diphosphohydrolase
MTRKLTEDKLVLASHNAGKLREIEALLEPYGKEVVSAGELGLPEPEETGQSFAENAEIKARAAAGASGLPAIADDSGLAVASLGGAPGIYSARWAGPEKDFQAAMRRVHEALADDLDRSAAFVCALALAWPDGKVVHVEGRVDGTIVWPPRGEGGFGYDPIFLPAEHGRTFGEMSPDEKQEISHRARAFRRLIETVLTDRTK